MNVFASAIFEGDVEMCYADCLRNAAQRKSRKERRVSVSSHVAIASAALPLAA